MKKKTDTKKPYKSLLSNAAWSFRRLMKYAPSSFFMLVLCVPLNIAMTYAGIYLPSLVVAEVTNNSTFENALLTVGGLLFAMLAGRILTDIFRRLSRSRLGIYRYKVTDELTRKSLGCFYQIYETKKMRDLLGRAERATQMWGGMNPLVDLPTKTLNLIEAVICYFLFGTALTFVSPWIVPILTAAPIVNWLCAKLYRKWEYNHREEQSDIDSKLWYVQSKPADFGFAKDIRIYGMAEWIRDMYRKLTTEKRRWENKSILRQFVSGLADLFIILIRDSGAYALLIAMALRGEITVDRFVFCFAAISSFASFIGSIIGNYNSMQSVSMNICDFREYLDIAESDGTGEAVIDGMLELSPEITFDHVTFRYDGAKTDTLKDISFTIKSGEKIALVGLNGAGKTTLVKLLCGLYEPTSGEIRINGIPVKKFYRRDYYKLFSPVFQNVETSFFSLAETVVAGSGDEPDYSLAKQCMRRAGLGPKIDSLPNGIYTKLDKQVNEDGIELSGGEVQKLMLARALYKDAPVLVLDEPTAALDPISESRVYEEYMRLSDRKSSLFISHRLASTRFCDRILYLDNGRIAEEGTHSELVGKGGKYAQLFEIQSCWYRDDCGGLKGNSGEGEQTNEV